MSSKQSEELSKRNSKRRKRRENGFEEWGGYMAAKKQKLQMQFEDRKALELMDQKETEIFKGIGIFVNGLTTPSADELKRLMIIHGGKFYHYPSSKITHVIASNLPKSKMKLLKRQVIVTGNWITDSIKAGKLLPHQNYFLYSPEVADNQQRLQIGNYFQKKPNSSPIKDNTPRKKNKDTSMLEELFGNDLDSDSSIDSEKNVQCNLVNKSYLHKGPSSNTFYQKHSTSNHNKVSSPVMPSLTGSSGIIASVQNQRISSSDSSHLKPSLDSTECHIFNERNLSNMKNKDKSILVGEDSETNANIGSGQNVKKSIPCKDSSHSKLSLNKFRSQTFNERSLSKNRDKNKSLLDELFGEDLDSDSSIDSQKNSKNISVSNSSHKKASSNASYERLGINNHVKVSSPLKSSSNVDISVSTQNQNCTNNDSSHLKSSSNFNNLNHRNIKNISVNQSTSNKQSSNSKPSKSGDESISLHKHRTSEINKESSYAKATQRRDASISPQKYGVSETNKESSYSKPSKTGDISISPQKHGRAVNTGDPNFLPEFFNHSRKHHISTSAQELKRYVQFLVESNKEKHFPKRDRLRELSQQFPDNSSFITSDPNTKGRRQVIMHLDMDCFFVSVGLKKHPELRGVPVAVTHSKGKRGGPQEGSDIHYEASHYANESKKKLKGVISGNELSRGSNQTPKPSIYSKEYGSLSEVACCSYEARQAGVRNGLFLGEALRRCPNLQTIPYDFEGYSEVSKQLYDIVASYTLDIEAVSCDELYIDCTELLQDVHLSPHQFASVLRAEIERETGCTASAGMGSNMLLARLATKVAKPNGQYYVQDADVEKFMKQQKVGDLPGVGYTTAEKLHGLNIRTCEDLQSWSLSKLQQKFGTKTGQAFYNNCRGKDDRIVQYHKDRKSVSAEVNYGIRFEMEDDIYNFINQLSNEVQNRIRNLNCKGKLVTLKLMVRKRDAPVETAKFMGHGVCDNLSHSVSLKSATDSSQVISKECCAIARSLKIKPQDYRGVGIQISKLESIQKDHKIGGGVFKQSHKKSATEMESSYGVFAPKNLEKVNKVISEKSTITHFLSNKSSPSKHLDNAVENDSVKGMSTSPSKQTEPPSKHGQKTKTIEHFLLNKPSTSRTKSYNIADFLPEELDQSVLEALPEDLKKEILESCKAKSAVNEGSSLNQSASTSSANKPDELVKSLGQKQKSEKIIVRVDSNPLQSKPIGLDQSFLNALPEELRKEVLDSYNSVSDKKNMNSASSSAEQQLSPSFASKSNNQSKIIPKKKSDNPTSAANSNLWSNSSLKLDESVLNALPADLKKEILESYGEHPSSKTGKLPQPSTSNQICSSKEYTSTEQQSSKALSEIDSNEKPVKKNPTLGGAIELDDLRALIKEWIDNTDDPLEEDINDVKTFLVELCDVDLCKVEILSKYLYRMANKSNRKWKDVYLTVLSSVQEKVMSIYKRTLILNSEFPT
ncbi:unnamed protein product [Larinioides sclopetarius]|uniref:DNA repair protein REV1 n=1 Tax=Larinioides sclopetarius TaxID=280406 RepID=A0AAV1YXK7_9ARAC